MNDHMDDVSGKIKREADQGTIPGLRREDWEKMLEPFYRELLNTPGVYSASAGSEGDRVFIFLRFEDDKVEQANFQTTGCMACSLCCFYASRMALGKSADELEGITGEKIAEFMGGLQEKERRCAFLAAEALRKVLSSYRMDRQTKRQNARKDHLVLVKPVIQ